MVALPEPRIEAMMRDLAAEVGWTREFFWLCLATAFM